MVSWNGTVIEFVFFNTFFKKYPDFAIFIFDNHVQYLRAKFKVTQ